MIADPMARAREMLAAALEQSGSKYIASAIRAGATRDALDDAALRVIATLLTREAEIRGEERERCARIADDNRTDDDSMWDRAAATIASAIRDGAPGGDIGNA